MRGLAGVIVVVSAACGRVGFTPAPVQDEDAEANPLSYAARVLASGPRAYYRLDDRAGEHAHDSSGNGLDAPYTQRDPGTITYDRTGALAASGDLDAAIELVGNNNDTIGNVASILLPVSAVSWAGDFTIEAFVHPTGAPPADYADDLFECEDYLVNGFRTGWNTSYQLRMWSTEASHTGSVTGTAAFDVGAWNHIAIVHAGTSIAFYLDGVAGGGVDDFDYAAPDSNADCGFGAQHGMATAADYDELALYERALPAAEVAAHFAAAQP